MQMPGRTYTASSSSYRYGFNGKEMDNETYGQGNEYDYGFRIYNPRIGKFLSVDPYSKKYPFYSPYQFAGDGPIANTDADGGEPQSYTWDWQPKKLFDLKSGQKLSENGGSSKTVDDPALGYVDVEMVYDSWTEQNWLIHQDDQGNYYYLQNDNGKNDVLTLKGGTIKISGGHLEPFKTYNQVAYEQTDALMKGIATGTAGAVALPFVIEALPAIGSAAWAAWSNPYVQYAIGGDIAGSYAYEYATAEERSVVAAASPSTSPANTKPTVVETPTPGDWNGPVDYSVLKEPQTVGPGLKTTPTQRQRILDYNRLMNGGVLRSDIDGAVLDAPANVPKGGKANMNQAEVDHMRERVNGGSNSNSNQRVVSKKQNLEKESQRRRNQ